MNNKLCKFIVGILISLYGAGLKANELNLSFLQGGGKVSAAAWESLNSRYIPGRYLVDVDLNGKTLGKRLISIVDEDKDELCLSEAWLQEAGVDIDIKFYAATLNQARQCYHLGLEPNTQIEFDYSAQNLKFMLPQAGLLRQTKALQGWDYGMNAVRLNYNANVNANDVDVNTYGGFGMVVNAGEWVANSSVSATESDVDVSMVTATRALHDLKADLTIGKTFVSNSLVGGASLLGLGVTSNSSMLPNDIGYTPKFSGFASTNARVTLIQNDKVVHSEMVPPGPFKIENANFLNSGDVLMTITEVDGSVSTQLFPLTILANMLNPGEFEYGFFAGLRDSGQEKLDGVFAAASYGYGFSEYTVKSSALLHAKYGAAGASLIRGLGGFGTIELEGAYSVARYDDSDLRNSGKFSLTYAKTFDKNTDLKLVGAQYTSLGYVEFSGFSPKDNDDNKLSKQKTQYEVGLSHRLSNSISASVSGWHRVYWNNNRPSTGLSASVSTRFDGLSLSLGGNYGKSGDKENYGASLSVSVPLSGFGQSYSLYSSLNATDSGSQSITSGITSSIDKLDYSASVGWANTGGDETYSLHSSHQGERMQLNGNISQSGADATGSAAVSGSVIILPKQKDIIFTRNMNDTIVIANVADTEGVKFTSSPYPTNNKGNTVIPVSSYSVNNVTLDGATLPIELELLTTSETAVPTSGSVVYMPFNAVKVKRYLFQIKDKDGQFMPSGTWATSSTGVPLGFIAQNGVLFVNSVDELKGLQLGRCAINGAKIKETHLLQEVTCEY
ncbi:PefC/AfrB family outer membrane usher protein [Moritella sp. 36]|uniref:PefC/AfrB family outer membrane usher protein n=1 Tax=Moritella sp. 36 TaxID=2746233 RepID=UPI001BA45CEC|nr:PefC/AfrB family outer membrane usher protein [Moritella sp. 36]QUM88180.1 PefC/AfrB family outer membrane usher protein [Moritella sp. 36]